MSLNLSNANTNREFHRIPKSVVPINYNLRTKVNFGEKSFDGSVSIDLLVKETTDKIKLNSVGLELTNIKFVTNDNKTLKCINEEFDELSEIVTLIFEDSFGPCEGSLNIDFSGRIKPSLCGLYFSTYHTADGVERTVAVTHLEAICARRVFPCMDEPEFKARFNITLVVPVHMTALSNTNVVSSEVIENDPGYKIVTFLETLIMPTYLVAYVVGELDSVKDYFSDEREITVYTPIGKRHLGEFALKLAKNVIYFFEEYFGVKYKLPKLDMVAVSDFEAGAMENWGIIIYRETALLVDENRSSANARQRVALVVAHELAHQWFGNLVTMKWWDDLWLNEAFATFMEYVAVDHLFPEYKVWNSFLVDEYAMCMKLDALENTHPIHQELNDPKTVDSIFDAISYSKGSCLVKAIRCLLGENSFRKGLQSYFYEFAFSNASTSDLMRHWSESSNKPVGDIMHSWIMCSGHPVLNVSVDFDTNGKCVWLHVSQKRFRYGSDSHSSSTNNTIWMVPITIQTNLQKNPENLGILDCKEKTFFLEYIEKPKWIILDPNLVGIYRCQYSDSMLRPLLCAFSNKELDEVSRLRLIMDMIPLSFANDLSPSYYFTLLSKCQHEDSYIVLSNILENYHIINILVQDADDEKCTSENHLNKILIRVLSSLMNCLGWEPTSNDHLQSMLRKVVIKALGRAKDPKVLEKARKQFDDHFNGGKKVSPEILSAVYYVVMSNGNQHDFDTLLKAYKETTLVEEKTQILLALGASRDCSIVKKTLDLSLSNDVRTQDIVFCLAGCDSTTQARQMRSDFVMKNWTTYSSSETAGFLLNSIVKHSFMNLSDKKDADKIKSFFEKNCHPGIERSVNQALEQIGYKSMWKEKYMLETKELLSQMAQAL